MYREYSRTMVAVIAIVIWLVNLAIAAVAIVFLAELLRGVGVAWMPELSFWQAILLRLLFKSLSWDAIKVTLRD